MLKRFKITLRPEYLDGEDRGIMREYSIVAHSSDKAWDKFNHQYFKQSPMKPSRDAWHVELVGDFSL